jgi:hypothetical protein
VSNTATIITLTNNGKSEGRSHGIHNRPWPSLRRRWYQQFRNDGNAEQGALVVNTRSIVGNVEINKQARVTVTDGSGLCNCQT